jgi:hypothetical protein
MSTPIWKNRALWTAVADAIFIIAALWVGHLVAPDLADLIKATLVTVQGVVVALIAAFTVESAVAQHAEAQVLIARLHVTGTDLVRDRDK